MSDFELIKEIKARKNWVFLVVLIVLITSIIYNSRIPFIYESTVIFFVDDDEAQGLKFNEADLILPRTSNINRLYNFAQSTEMIDHLLSKFNLYNHFNIDANSPQHYERVSATIKNNIYINGNSFNSLSVTVKDVDKMLAAEMANEIFIKLDEMNKDFIITNIERKINIYEQLLANIKKQSSEQVEQLRLLVEECKQLLTNNQLSKSRDNILIADLRTNFSLLTSQLTVVNSDLTRTSRAYGIAVATLQKENIPSLRIINKALPDLRSPRNIAISWTLALSLAALFVTIILIMIIHQYKFHFKAFME